MAKIIVVTTSLNIGGITAFLIPMVNEYAKMGHDVSLAYTVDTGDYLKRLDKSVKLVKFHSISAIGSLFAVMRNLHLNDVIKIKTRKSTSLPVTDSVQRVSYDMSKYIHISEEHYDVAISTAEFYCNAIVANAINADRKIAWVHPDIGKLNIDLKASLKMIDNFYRVVSVSRAGLESLNKLFPLQTDKFLYIPNLMDTDYIISKSKDSISDVDINFKGRKIVSVARIDNSSKRIDRMLRIASILKKRNFNFRWFIVGDGSDAELINKMIVEEQLQDSVIMLGRRNNPYPYIAYADYFVMTSQYEGKPIAVEEAKILHTPVISTEYTAAHEQILEKNGRVVVNEDGKLEDIIAGYLIDDLLLRKLKKSASTYIFDNSSIIEQLRNIVE